MRLGAKAGRPQARLALQSLEKQGRFPVWEVRFDLAGRVIEPLWLAVGKAGLPPLEATERTGGVNTKLAAALASRGRGLA